jgi:hypothetical protein
MAVPRIKIPEVLKPRLRLFMSIDVVGSTALKQPSFQERLVDWFLIIQSFYGETVLAVQDEWAGLQSKVLAKDQEKFLGDAPQFWKTVGDEVLYYKDVTDSRQIGVTIECWKRAVASVRAFFYKQNEDILKDVKLSLDVKATVWSAGFPRRNKAIISPSGLLTQLRPGRYAQVFREAHERAYTQSSDALPSNRVELDFIGPGIDIGFRLCGFSTTQKLVISMDVAYMLARCRGDQALTHLDIHYDGRVPLRGVFNGKPYPLFWIDNSAAGSFEAKESKARHPTRDMDIIGFCDTFYDEIDYYQEFAHRPFVRNDPGGCLGEEPSGYGEWLQDEVRAYRKWQRDEDKQIRKEQELREAEATASDVGKGRPIDPEEVSRLLISNMGAPRPPRR